MNSTEWFYFIWRMQEWSCQGCERVHEFNPHERLRAASVRMMSSFVGFVTQPLLKLSSI